MSYYLSKRDRELIVPILEKLQISKRDVEIPVSNPQRLTYLVRNAWNVMDEYKPLRHKYMILTRETKVIFRLKFIDLNPSLIQSNATSFIDLVTELFNKPVGLVIPFVNYRPSDDEYAKLKKWADQNGYIIKVTLTGMEIMKI